MEKKRKPIFLKTLIIILVFLVVESAFMIFFTKPDSYVSGYSIKDLSQTYTKFYPNSKMFLIVQWVLILIILLFAFLRNIKIHKQNKTVGTLNVSSAVKSSKTSLDALYLVLKEKKSLSIATISNAFDIDSDLAMEWARILESGDLVNIDYPGFGSPIVNIAEEETEEEKPSVKGKDLSVKEEKPTVKDSKEGKKGTVKGKPAKKLIPSKIDSKRSSKFQILKTKEPATESKEKEMIVQKKKTNVQKKKTTVQKKKEKAPKKAKKKSKK